MAWSVIYTVEDEGGTKSTFQVNLNGSVLFENAVAVARAFAQIVNNVITGAIRSVNMTNSVEIDDLGLKVSPSANSDIEEGGYLQFITSGGHYTGFRLPTLNESYIDPDGSVDVLDPEIALIVSSVATGIDVNLDPILETWENNAFSDARDEDIVALSFARDKFLSTRGSRK